MMNIRKNRTIPRNDDAETEAAVQVELPGPESRMPQ